MSKKLPIVLLLALLAGAGPSRADEREALEGLRATTMNLIRLLVEEGVITREKAETLMREAQRRAQAAGAVPKPATDAAGKKIVRVPYVPEHVKNEIREQIKTEVLEQARNERWGDPGSLPSWLGRFTLEGDLRVRAQFERFDPNNAPPAFFQVQGQDLDNTLIDRNRGLVRARLGIKAKVSDEVIAGLRLTTGNSDSPVSTSQTLGGSSSKYSFALDRAYVQVEPSLWMTGWGGRIPNPWLSTDLIWHDDLGFEGLAARFSLPEDRSRELTPFLTVGAFALQEVELSSQDKWLLGAQVGVDWRPNFMTRVRLGAAVYDHRNYAGQPNAAFSNLNDYTAPRFRQKGNSLFDISNDGNPATNTWALAPNYRPAALTAAVEFSHWDPVYLVVTGEYVRNLAYDRAEIRSRTGLDIPEKTTGYQARVTVGMPRMDKEHDWQFFLGYRYLERDAVVDAFNSSDFHLGGTNHRGFVVGGSYGLYRNTWVTGRWLSTREIDGLPLAIDVFQIDFNARF